MVMVSVDTKKSQHWWVFTPIFDPQGNLKNSLWTTMREGMDATAHKLTRIGFGLWFRLTHLQETMVKEKISEVSAWLKMTLICFMICCYLVSNELFCCNYYNRSNSRLEQLSPFADNTPGKLRFVTCILTSDIHLEGIAQASRKTSKSRRAVNTTKQPRGEWWKTHHESCWDHLVPFELYTVSKIWRGPTKTTISRNFDCRFVVLYARRKKGWSLTVLRQCSLHPASKFLKIIISCFSGWHGILLEEKQVPGRSIDTP